jgi:S-DNA-T family DNA segregation ATPase FtsK/SpoIIIE
MGSALALRFSWLKVADALGDAGSTAARPPRGPRARRPKTAASASRLLREREQVVEESPARGPEHPPIVIEPPVLEVPKSERVAKERQKPLFAELADTKLPQVDLLDVAARPPGDGDAEDAGDDQPADREEAQGLRRRGARGRRQPPAR